MVGKGPDDDGYAPIVEVQSPLGLSSSKTRSQSRDDDSFMLSRGAINSSSPLVLSSIKPLLQSDPIPFDSHPDGDGVLRRGGTTNFVTSCVESLRLDFSRMQHLLEGCTYH